MYNFEHQSALGAARPKGRILDILLQCREIRDKLGTKEYLLDCYVQNFFGAWKETTLSEIAALGVWCGEELESICESILTGEASTYDRIKDFYGIASSFVAVHPLSFQEIETKCYVYACALFDKFVLAKSNFIERDVLDEIDFDADGTKDVYMRICELLGDQGAMDALNNCIHRMLVSPTLMEIYLRGMTEHLLVMLDHRDFETSRQVFQLLLDNPQLLTDASKL